MTDRSRIAPLSKFEEEVGFTRAIRVENRILVSGTTANLPDGTVPVEAGDQADLIFAEIIRHIEELGGKVDHVVRVRMFVTDISYADAVSASFSRHMKVARPTGTLVAISDLYRAEWKVEIEAEAVVPADR